VVFFDSVTLHTVTYLRDCKQNVFTFDVNNNKWSWW